MIAHGCGVATRDIRPTESASPRGDETIDAARAHEEYAISCIEAVTAELGHVINVAVVLVDVENDSDDGNERAIWDIDTKDWERRCDANVHGPFFVVKQFLQAAWRAQQGEPSPVVGNPAVVLVSRRIDGLLRNVFNKAAKAIRLLSTSSRVNAIALQRSTEQREENRA